jgi:predicted amidohydrolase
MRLALAKMKSVVGDLDGNRNRILELFAEAHGAGADLVLFPELAVTGYPPEDLLLRPAFVRAARKTVEEIAARRDGRTSGHPTSTRISNAHVLSDGGA